MTEGLSHLLSWEMWDRIPNVKAHGSGVRSNGVTFLPKTHIATFPSQLCFLSSYLLIQVTESPFLIISELRVIHFYALWFIGSNFKTSSHQIWILQEIRTTWICKIKPAFWRVKSTESWQDFKGKTVAKIIQVKDGTDKKGQIILSYVLWIFEINKAIYMIFPQIKAVILSNESSVTSN